ELRKAVMAGGAFLPGLAREARQRRGRLREQDWQEGQDDETAVKTDLRSEGGEDASLHGPPIARSAAGRRDAMNQMLLIKMRRHRAVVIDPAQSFDPAKALRRSDSIEGAALFSMVSMSAWRACRSSTALSSHSRLRIHSGAVLANAVPVQ